MRIPLRATEYVPFRGIPTTGAVATVALGAVLGIGIGLAAEPYIAALLYHVKAGDPVLFAAPLLILLCAAILAALPPVTRAVRIDPAVLLRCD